MIYLKTPKIFLFVILFILALCISIYFIFFRNNDFTSKFETKSPSKTTTTKPAIITEVSDYKNGTYNIDGEFITLKNGSSEEKPEPNSITTITTEFFGNEAKGDINGDGKEDIVFLLAQYGGGTGVFYYAVSALRTENGYKGTNAVFLGDRIAPQTTEIREGQIIINYAERRVDEPMTAEPSVGVSKYLKISGEELIVVK